MIICFRSLLGKNMVARLALPGTPYGRNGCLKVDAAMIEFYAIVERGDGEWLNKLYDVELKTCFVSRYYLDTFLLGFAGNGTSLSRGLCLDGAYHEFDLSAEDCRKVTAYLFIQLAGRRPHADIQSD